MDLTLSPSEQSFRDELRSWLADNQLEDLLELPSAGDNSYPGFVELSPTRALLSYYSTHETGPDSKSFTAIYMADLGLEA